MIFKCDKCGSDFFEPKILHHRENLDGENGIWEFDYYVCPNCGSDEIKMEDDTE